MIFEKTSKQTDACANMGKGKEHEERVKVLKLYQVKSSPFEGAKLDHIFMLGLAVHRGEEVTGEVADSKSSVALGQRKNKKCTN